MYVRWVDRRPRRGARHGVRAEEGARRGPLTGAHPVDAVLQPLTIALRFLGSSSALVFCSSTRRCCSSRALTTVIALIYCGIICAPSAPWTSGCSTRGSPVALVWFNRHPDGEAQRLLTRKRRKSRRSTPTQG